ncbi:MAG: DNA repair protein RecN [Breznakibacter sp.]
MLKSLSVSNYALIEKVDIAFYQGFSVITGETGAGKSILLGALGLILGQRADASVLKDAGQKCVVEATFDISGYQMEDILAGNDLDYEPLTLVRREILPAGKSRAFVNDTPVNLAVLKDFTSRLIDIHSQHQTLLLGENHFQLMVVDAVADTAVQKNEYLQFYQQYRQLLASLAKLKDENEKQKGEFDYLQFQYQQLAEAKLEAGEQTRLEQQLQEMTHAADIKSALLFVVNQLDGENFPVLAGLKEAQSQLSKVAGFLHDGQEIINRIETSYLDLKDLAIDLSNRSGHIDHDAGEIARVQARLGLLYELQQKHRVASEQELVILMEEYGDKLKRISNFDEEVENLQKRIDRLKAELSAKADVLSQKRSQVFPHIEKSLLAMLADLGMPNAKFQVSNHPKPDFSPDGIDDIVFLFTANKAGQLAELERVASGGEMSRLMLCIKALLSTAKGLPTLLLDEIDTGVSGEIADKMGDIMQSMAAHMQVISITHLPQIAAKGHIHYMVSKKDLGHKQATHIEQLGNDQRVVEIAKMLSGSVLSEAALSNARELLKF